MKKILSAALAALLAVSALTTTAFADDLVGNNSIKAEGSVGVPALKITMPKSMAFVFNPYKLKMTDKGKVDATAGVESVIVGAFTNEAKDSWVITNGSGGAVKCAFFVVGEVADATKSPDLVLRDNSASGDPADGKKDVKIKIEAKADTLTATAKILAAAPANTAKWFDATDSTSGIARIATIADTKTLEIKPTAVATNKTNSAWNENDKFNLNFVFQFEFADPA